MAAHYLGSDFAIHGGGSDLIFPHHENEIAQSEGATGEAFARFWLHNGMVNLGGEKMSKSTGRLVGLLEATETYGGAALRLFYLRAHYRSPLEYSTELLEGAAASIERIQRFVQRSPLPDGVPPDGEVIAKFTAAMDNDFSTPEALAVLFDAMTDANRLVDEGNDAASLIAAVYSILDVLGIEADAVVGDADAVAALALELGLAAGSIDEMMEALLEARSQARRNKDFALSDQIRARLANAHITVEDTADGQRWFWR
jgi:cysteinyl-tRNA synthetase